MCNKQNKKQYYSYYQCLTTQLPWCFLCNSKEIIRSIKFEPEGSKLEIKTNKTYLTKLFLIFCQLIMKNLLWNPPPINMAHSLYLNFPAGSMKGVYEIFFSCKNYLSDTCGDCHSGYQKKKNLVLQWQESKVGFFGGGCANIFHM